jgi:hypothetical protein
VNDDVRHLLGKTFDQVLADPLVSSLGGTPSETQVEDRCYLVIKEAGLSCDADLDRVTSSVFLYAEGYQGFHAYPRRLPHNLDFSDSRQAVRRKLGEPMRSGERGRSRLLGELPAWDLYDYGAYALHVTYSAGDASVVLVTLMSPERVPAARVK